MKNLFLTLLILSTLYLIPAPSHAALSDGLVGYWTFDGKDTNWGTNKTNDVSGQGNTGTMTSMSTTTSPVMGKIGQALKFNGSSSYITVPDNSSIDLATNFTVTGWIKRNVLGNYDVIYGSGQQTNYWYVQISNGNKLVFSKRDITDFSANTVIDANWHHIAVVKNGDSGTNLSFYFDGKADGTASVGSVTTPSGTKYIGNFASGGSIFHGNLDDVRIYNRALSASEVAKLYKQGAAKLAVSPVNSIKSGLVGYWTFDGKDTNWGTNKTNDVSGQGNTGTMVSMSTTTSPVVGKIGQALRFNGGVSNANGSYIDVTNQASFNFERTNSFSSSVWIKPQTLSSTIQHIVGNLGNTSPYRGWELWIDSAGRVNLTLESTYPTDQLAVHTNSALSLNKWQNVSFTYNGTSAPSGVTIYVNGISQTLTTDQNTLSATIQNSVDFGIGQRTDNIGSNSWPFTGFIDDVRVYSRALSASEVNQLYKLGATVSR